jgi:nucleotide-binding universal stress UspA family protein
MVKDIKNLLYATDLSKNSAFAFRYALKLANCFDANITVLYILPVVDSAMEVPIITQMGEDKYYKLQEEKSRETIEGIKERIRLLSEKGKEDTQVKTDRVSSILVHEGDPVEEILITSDELNSDMIILGSHGKGMLKHTFLGTIPEKVLRRSRRPVLIVPIPKGITDIDL